MLLHMSPVRRVAPASLAIALALNFASPAQAQAQAQQSDEAAALRTELAQMRSQMEVMASRIEMLEGETAREDGAVDTGAVAAPPSGEVAAPAPMPVAALEAKDGWTFKPFGRLQIDAGTVKAPDAISDQGLGFANEIRRARIGVAGDLPGGFAYKMEVDFADGEVELTDALFTYEKGDATVTIGQHNNFQGLEELSSSRFISFLERASFTDAFGFERKVGLSGQYENGGLLLQAGVFTANADDLSSDENNSWSFDGRSVYAPTLGDTRLHFGGSVHYRKLNNADDTVSYRQRPHFHFTDTRFINTGSIAAETEIGFGLETAAISGPFHFASEAFWQQVERPELTDPTFFGGYIEAGVFLTAGDTRGYKGFKFDRVKPARPLGKNGLGALQLNVRYDYLDLVDAEITGGIQNSYAASLVWTPTAYTRFMLDYSHLEYDMAAIAAGGDRDYSVDVVGVRAQVDF